LVDAPFRTGHWLTEIFADRGTLRVDNARLKTELRDAKLDLQTMAALREENQRLRALGEAASAVTGKRMIAEIMHVDLDPLRHRVLLNKGQQNGVFKGQPVLDADGVVGQITRVGRFTAEAILISDPEHAIPVRVNRTGRRTIAQGTGNLKKLTLPFLTGEEDIKVGDLLITSGLGGVFPAGYPLGTISKVERNPAETFATVEAKPLAKLDSDYEVVLLWYQPPSIEAPLSDAPATQDKKAKAASSAASSMVSSTASSTSSSASSAASSRTDSSASTSAAGVTQ
jgi:rod shape-determining protein MreC